MPIGRSGRFRGNRKTGQARFDGRAVKLLLKSFSQKAAGLPQVVVGTPTERGVPLGGSEPYNVRLLNRLPPKRRKRQKNHQ